MEIKDSSYSDDLAAVLWRQPAQAHQVLQSAGEIAWFVYERCGFRLNWGPLKTAAMVAWYGPESKTYKLELQQKYGNQVTLRNGTRSVELEVVDEYKRVGTTKTALAGLGREINVRASAAWHKLRGLRKRLFRAPAVKQEVKRSTLRTPFLSSQLFNAGA